MENQENQKEEQTVFEDLLDFIVVLRDRVTAIEQKLAALENAANQD